MLGTPTKEEIHSMNPNYTQFKFPLIKAHPWTRVFNKRMPPDAVDLVRSLTCATNWDGVVRPPGGGGAGFFVRRASRMGQGI